MTDNQRPETLYDLCEEVCVSIEAMPQNYNQEHWAIPVSRISDTGCGTAYCRAGWMCAILDQGKPKASGNEESIPSEDAISRHIVTRAARLLEEKGGISRVEVSNLFSGAACGNTNYGTPEYTKAGIKGMKDFMEKHKAALRAYKIKEGD